MSAQLDNFFFFIVASVIYGRDGMHEFSTSPVANLETERESSDGKYINWTKATRKRPRNGAIKRKLPVLPRAT